MEYDVNLAGKTFRLVKVHVVDPERILGKLISSGYPLGKI